MTRQNPMTDSQTATPDVTACYAISRRRLRHDPSEMAMVIALIAMVTVFTAGTVLAQTGSDGDKPTFDGAEDMGITPSDTDGLGKGATEPTPAPPPRAQQAPAPSPAPQHTPDRPDPPATRHDASPFSGSPYVWGSLGWVAPDDADLSGSQFGAAALDDAINYGGALGWHFDNGLRTELELSYFDSDVDSIANKPVSGDLDVLNGMANVVYEVPFFDNLKPYGGAGIGVAAADADINAPGPSSGEDTVFAYQFIGGTAVNLTRRVDLTLDYRYFETEDPDFGKFEADLSGHKVLGGIRYTFKGPEQGRM